MLQLEIPCPTCEATGEVQCERWAQHKYTCSKCGGRCKIPSEQGEELLDFIAHHLSQDKVWKFRGYLVEYLMDTISKAVKFR